MIEILERIGGSNAGSDAVWRVRCSHCRKEYVRRNASRARIRRGYGCHRCASLANGPKIARGHAAARGIR